MENRQLKIALAQMAMTDSKKDNLVRSLELLEKAAAEGADLILYPEVQLSPFFAQFPGNPGGCCGGLLGPEAVTADDAVFRMFSEMRRKYHIAASPNFYYQEQKKNYDASFLFDKEGKSSAVRRWCISPKHRSFMSRIITRRRMTDFMCLT